MSIQQWNERDGCKSHDASDSFDNIEIPNNGKDFDQNSLLPDEDTEKKGVSKSLNSNNGKDGFAPENDSLDTFPQDTDRFETKDVCLASLGEKTDPDSDGVFTPLESENGDGPENNPKNCIISSDDDENATENRHTKMMGKHGFDPLPHKMKETTNTNVMLMHLTVISVNFFRIRWFYHYQVMLVLTQLIK